MGVRNETPPPLLLPRGRLAGPVWRLRLGCEPICRPRAIFFQAPHPTLRSAKGMNIIVTLQALVDFASGPAFLFLFLGLLLEFNARTNP